MPTPDPRSPRRAAQPVSTDRVFRSLVDIATGAVLLVVVLCLGIAAVVTTDGGMPWKAPAAMLLVIPLLFALTLRPAVGRVRVAPAWTAASTTWDGPTGRARSWNACSRNPTGPWTACVRSRRQVP
ncbi:hypothetical protein [Streptomyces sp. NPDC127105]|uniref:hypothetical protein n=1 Tax=Streptomyces sp. NPDC127105 TaxID=3345359 RepID=UPI00365746EC